MRTRGAGPAPNSRRRAVHFAEAGDAPWLEAPFDKAELGFILGRSSCAMLALTDAGFSAAIVEKLAAFQPLPDLAGQGPGESPLQRTALPGPL